MPGQAPVPLQCWYAKTRNFVMAGLTKNPRLNEALSKADSKANRNTNGNNAPLAVRDGADWARQEAVYFLQCGKGQP